MSTRASRNSHRYQKVHLARRWRRRTERLDETSLTLQDRVHYSRQMSVRILVVDPPELVTVSDRGRVRSTGIIRWQPAGRESEPDAIAWI
jgi:hypothetical protein